MIAIGAVIIGAAFVLSWSCCSATACGPGNRSCSIAAKLPPAGTAIFIDAKGLSVGAEVFAWPSLAIGQVELTRTSVSSATRPA